MHSSPDVSVILPVRNRASYLADSITSICQQQWSGTLEVLCVDDGSEVDPFTGLPDPLPLEVQLFRKPHEGVGAARRYALERARGRYVAFNDDDDLWLPGKLAMQIAVLEQHHELDMVFSDLREFSASGEARATRLKSRPELSLMPRTRLAPRQPPLYRYERASLIGAFVAGVPLFFQTVVARREFLDRIGGMEARARSCGDTLDFAVRAAHGGTMGYLDVPTFLLRRGHTHMTGAAGWIDRELEEFLAIFPSYPHALQRHLQPLFGKLLSNRGWHYFRHREYRAAARAYRAAARHGAIGVKARAKWALAALLSLFQGGNNREQPGH